MVIGVVCAILTVVGTVAAMFWFSRGEDGENY